ncbi:MAG: DUF2628 domain-containing protein [Acetobacteraceae bacterium]
MWTAHLRPRAPPVLIAEGFSWGALLFGGLWLLVHRAWIAGVLALAAGVLIGVLTQGVARGLLEFTLAVLLGLNGRDLLRWSLARRGYTLAQVVAAGNEDAALARFLTARPDLAATFMAAQAAR